DEKLSGKDRIAALNQLHIAEYQALTNRASYWIVMQFGLLPVVPAYLVLAIYAWPQITIKEILIWITLAGLQVIALLWTQALSELYRAVRYIECYLRPRIREGIDTYRFWGYEPYLINHRTTYRWEFLYPILGSIFIAIILTIRLLQNFSWRWDGSGLLLNLMLLTILWLSTIKARRI